MKVFKFSELLIISFLVSLLTACSFFSFGGDFSEILNDSLKTKITYFDKNPLENEDAINFEVSYKIGSRQASLAQPEDKIKEFKTKHPGYNVGGWKYLCNALDNTITKVPEGIEIKEDGFIGSLEIPVDAFWVYAFWVPATDTPYKVIHWTQNTTLDGYDIHLEENKTGTTETLTSAAALELEGFEALAFEQQSIDAEGKTVINIYYNRKKINISVVYNGNKKQFSGYYGQTLDSADFNVNDFAPDGYTFDKWTVTYADGSTEEIEDAVITFTKDGAEYTAGWKEITYTITYILQPEGESTVSNAAWAETYNPISERTVNVSVVLPDNIFVLRTGYTFDGWYTDPSYTNSITFISSGEAKDYVLYAKWNPIIYTITYELNGGNWVTGFTAESSITIEQSLTLPLESALVKDGYNFTGWYSDSGLTNNISEITTGTSSNITVYAAWRVAGAHAGNIVIIVPVSSDADFVFGYYDCNNNLTYWEFEAAITSIKVNETPLVLSNMTINWYLDGSVIKNNSTFAEKNITTPGCYLLTIVATDNTTGESYSFSSEIRITI